MGKRIILALAVVSLMAAPAFASVQNVKVGGSLTTTSVIRSNFDLNDSVGATVGGGDTAQNVVLSQVGLNVSADLTDNVSTSLKLVNERLWGAEFLSGTNTNSTVVLDEAYVTMKEMLYSPLTVVIGRQPLAYGNQFLIGDLNGAARVATVSDLSGGVSADAIKAVLSYDPLTVDVFAAKITEDGTYGANEDNDVDLFGINANYKFGDKMSTVVEAYTFARMDRSAIDNTDTETQKLYVPGLRVSTNPIEGLNVQLEGAYQVGNTGAATTDEVVKAFGLQGMVNYALPVMKDMKPVLSAGYTYLSGTKDATQKNNSFDPLYENQNCGRIFDGLFADNNIRIATVGFEVAPIQDVTTKLSWFNLNQIYKNAAGTVGMTDTLNGNSKGLGDELDLDVSYAYTEDVKFGVSAGVFFPGKAFTSDRQDTATQLLTSVAVLF